MRVLLALMLLAGACRADAPGATEPGPTLVLFLVDGLQPEAVATAAANGGTNLASLLREGVAVERALVTSPAPRMYLPDGSLPWGNATSGNVAVHTGCHLHESRRMDDLFAAAREAGLRSVFVGGDANYSALDTADFSYAGNLPDAEVVSKALHHLNVDGVRLLRLHLQRIRDHWTGPTAAADPGSPYVQHLLKVDALVGQVIAALRARAVWEQAFFILTSDHGMGPDAASDHPASAPSSWRNVMLFRGPGLKRGQTIPYAELPDVAVTAAHLLGLRRLAGHTDPAIPEARRRPTGTLLQNLFTETPRELPHPRLIERYLQANEGRLGDAYAHYREAMLPLVSSSPAASSP